MKPFKIRYWKSPKESQTFVFNGKAAKNEIEIPNMINDDDNINILLKKLCVYLKPHLKKSYSGPDDFYLWIKRKISKNDTLILNFINNCFKNDKKITYEYFQQCVSNYFNHNLPSLSYTVIDKNLSYRILNEYCKFNEVIEPIQFKYTDNGYFKYLCYDPFNTTTQLEENVEHYEVSSYFSMTLESFGIEDRTINMILYDKDKTLYFPNKGDTSFSFQKTEEFIKQISNIEKDVEECLTDMSGFKTNYFINYFSAKINELNYNEHADLGLLFDRIHASTIIPFIKYRTKSNIYYKINKESLLGFPEEEIEKMKSYKQQSKIESSFIQFKMKFSEDSYCSLFVSETFIYHIKFNLKKKEKTTLDKIEKFYEKINDIIKVIRTNYSNYEIPFITAQNINIIEMSTNNSVIFENKTIKYDNFESTIKNKLFPYFNILPINEPNIMFLQYKKIDNYIKYDNIQAFITRNYKLEKDAMIELLMSDFLMSKEESERQYEAWLKMNQVEVIMKDEKKIIKPKSDTFVNLKIRLGRALDLDCTITGLKNIDLQKRLLSLLKVLVDFSNKPIKPEERSFDYDKEMYPLEKKKDTFIEEKDFGIEIEDDDIELDPEFLDIEKDIIEAKEKSASPEKLTKKQGRGKGLVLERLLDYDKNLFHYEVTKDQKRKDYATVCTGRQPIAITKEEKQFIDSKYPGSYEGYLKVGSTPELMKKNYYICPAIWCPLSKTSMTYDDYKKNKCPKGEDPILSTNKSYWGEGEKALTRKRFPSVLDVNIHPKGFCMPCCFKLDSTKDGTRNKDRLKKCYEKTPDLIQIHENSQVTKPNTTPETPIDIIGNPRYILNDDKIPLENQRFGLISAQLGKILGNKRGNTGLVAQDVDCYLRKGVDNKESPFIAALLNIIDNNELKTIDDFTNKIIKSLTIDKYIQIENGKMLKLFINNEFDIQTNYKSFVKWFQEQNKYIKMFNLHKILKEVTSVSSFDQEKLISYKEIIREFMIYNSYKHFMDYIKDPNYTKDHRVLIDFLNIDHSIINVNYYNIVLIEEFGDHLNILCPFNRDTKNFINPNNPFVFIIQNGKYYETLNYIIGGNLKNIKYKFEYKNSPIEIQNLIKYFYNNCSTQLKNEKTGEDLCLFLQSNGYKIKYYVIDYSMRVRGLLLQNNLYIPFIKKIDVFNVKKSKFIYYNDIVRFKCISDDVETIYNKLLEFDEYYKIKSKHQDYLVLKNDTIIPLRLNKNDVSYQLFNDDLDIFIMHKEEREIINLKDSQKYFDKMIVAFIEYINKKEDIKKEIEFIINPINPLPRNFKRKKLFDLLMQISKDLSETNIDLVNKLTEKLLIRTSINLFGKLKTYSSSNNEILLDHHDILNKKLDEAIEYQRNPYKLLSERLNQAFGEYVYDDIDIYQNVFPKDYELSDVFNKFKPTLTNYGFKKISSDGIYDINYLYNLFISINNYLNPRRKLTINIIKSIIRNKIIKDHNSNDDDLDEFYNNPAYQFLSNSKNNTPKLEKCIEIFDSMYYYPCDYEIKILAELLQINVVLLARQGKKVKFGVKIPHDGIDVIHNNSDHYVLLEKHHIETKGKENLYRFDIIVKADTMKFVLTQNEIKRFYDVIIKNKIKVFEIEIPSSVESNS